MEFSERTGQADLCSEHALRPASVPGSWWCKRPNSAARRDDKPRANSERLFSEPAELPVQAGASLDELRHEWRRLYRSEPPKISRDLLIRGIGYRLQEIEHGG